MRTKNLLNRLLKLIKENMSFLAVLFITSLSLVLIVGVAFGSLQV